MSYNTLSLDTFKIFRGTKGEGRKSNCRVETLQEAIFYAIL